MTQIVITQPMLFPWVGLFEQLQLAEVCVFYDNVAFARRSFINRVQIPLHSHSTKWLTLPVVKHSRGTLIRDLVISREHNWKAKHIAFLQDVYQKAPFKTDMLELVHHVYSANEESAMSIIIKSMLAICQYYDIDSSFRLASQIQDGSVQGKSEKLLEIVQACKGKTYITGHGALNYLDHALFETHHIQVRYMDYAKKAYPQISTQVFNPYVSTLDLIANLGPEGKEIFCPKTLDWKEICHAS